MGRYAELRFYRADEIRKRPGEVTFRARPLPYILATEIYGFDTTRAKKFVDDLRGRLPASMSEPTRSARRGGAAVEHRRVRARAYRLDLWPASRTPPTSHTRQTGHA